MIGLEFIAYVLFIICGLFIGGVLVYPVWQYLVRLDPGSEKKGLMGMLVTAIIAIFAASR